MMHHSVYECGGEGRVIGEGCYPLREGQVAGDDDGAALIAFGDDLEQQDGLMAIKRQVAKGINAAGLWGY